MELEDEKLLIKEEEDEFQVRTFIYAMADWEL